MADRGRLELELVDVHGVPISERVDIHLRHHVLSDQRRVASVDGSRRIAVVDLRAEPQGLYELEIEAPSYWPISRFVTVRSTPQPPERVVLPIRPDRARGVFPEYDALDDRVQGVLERSDGVAGHEGRSGRALYAALDDEARGGLLNIARKSLATTFKGGTDLLPHVTLVGIQGDRCFVEVPQALREQMPALDHFRSVSGSLHDPPPGFQPDGSFKTPDAFGNLQITFFRSDLRWRADVDIDDAAGLGHVFQVVRNRLSGKPTHPYNIHQILMAHQHLDPGYRLLPVA